MFFSRQAVFLVGLITGFVATGNISLQNELALAKAVIGKLQFLDYSARRDKRFFWLVLIWYRSWFGTDPGLVQILVWYIFENRTKPGIVPNQEMYQTRKKFPKKLEN